MNSNQIKASLLAGCISSIFVSSAANATHFRGAALVPTVDSTGVLTIDSKSFWQPGRANGTGGSISVAGAGNATLVTSTVDTSDIRRDESNQSYQIQLPGAGLYTMSWAGTSWVHNVPNASGGYGSSSTIFWNGNGATAPIIFDLENIQQEVVRGNVYSDNLDAVGNNLTYDDTFLARGVSSQAAGFSIDSSGQINVSAAATSGYLDNTNPASVGADQAFSGTINSSDGSQVEFVWLFDAVGTASNNAPSITDVVINALVGDTISHTLVVTDSDGDPVVVSFNSLFGPGGVTPGNSLFNTTTLDFLWDTTSFGVGSYVATFNATDGSLTDQGTIRINLTTTTPPPPVVSAPAGTFLLGMGLLSLVSLRRKKAK